MVSCAKKQRKIGGVGSRAVKKKGRPLEQSTVEIIRNFYLSDEISRIMPGRKYFKLFRIDGVQHQEQKRLLTGNIRTLHEEFKKMYPHIKVSVSKFRQLTSSSMYLSGPKGTHNVCECKTHENVRLKFAGIKKQLKQLEIELNYRNCLKGMICSPPKPDCFLQKCSNCPGNKEICDRIKLIFQTHNISSLSFDQWTSTDR